MAQLSLDIKTIQSILQQTPNEGMIVIDSLPPPLEYLERFVEICETKDFESIQICLEEEEPFWLQYQYTPLHRVLLQLATEQFSLPI